MAVIFQGQSACHVTLRLGVIHAIEGSYHASFAQSGIGGGRSEPHHEVEGGRSTVRADTEENVGHDGYPTDPNHPFNRAR